ncbi:hypothetical protein ACFL00_04530 [Pseudomonadota bacterium]
MNFVSAIDHACNDLEHAGHDGHLVNQSMVGFVFCKALKHEIPDAHVVYDGRASQDYQSKPNLYVWQDGAVPVVNFIGNIRYGHHSDTDGREQIKSLENCAALPTIPVLTHAPDSLKYNDRNMRISPATVLGAFIVNERSVVFRSWSPLK